MKIDKAIKVKCLRGDGLCTADKCMAWLLVDPKDLEEGVCMYFGVTTAFMKVLHLWGQMITAPKSNIVG